MTNNLSINLSDYGYAAQSGAADGGFVGNQSMQDVDLLNKALAAQDITGRDTTNMMDASGAPLKVEDLNRHLKHITFRESDIRLWKDLPKIPAYNTVVEFNQLNSYGEDRGGFNREGELPDEEDSIYVRRAQFVKYLGVTKSVTHQMTLVNTMIGSVMERTIKDGTLWILRTLNRGLYFGNADNVPEQFDGYFAQQQKSDAWGNNYNTYMTSGHVVDCRGQVLQEDNIESGANTIVESYGLATQLYAPPAVLSNFVKNFYGNKFIMPNTPALTNGTMGQVANNFASQFGNIGLNHDVFARKLPNKLAGSAATSLRAPNAPGAITTAVVSLADNSVFGSGDAGSVYYAVTAINRYGESALSIAAAATAIVAGAGIDITIPNGGGTYPATAFRVYRTKAGGTPTSQFYPLFDISAAQLTAGYDGGAAGIARDLNRWLPDTDQAMLVQFDTEVLEFTQLAPLMKMDLAVLSPAYRFMILLYGTPLLYAPKKMVRIINIGTRLPA
jgi:hypothetical protein